MATRPSSGGGNDAIASAAACWTACWLRLGLTRLANAPANWISLTRTYSCVFHFCLCEECSAGGDLSKVRRLALIPRGLVWARLATLEEGGPLLALPYNFYNSLENISTTRPGQESQLQAKSSCLSVVLEGTRMHRGTALQGSTVHSSKA